MRNKLLFCLFLLLLLAGPVCAQTSFIEYPDGERIELPTEAELDQALEALITGDRDCRLEMHDAGKRVATFERKGEQVIVTGAGDQVKTITLSEARATLEEIREVETDD